MVDSLRARRRSARSGHRAIGPRRVAGLVDAAVGEGRSSRAHAQAGHNPECRDADNRVAYTRPMNRRDFLAASAAALTLPLSKIRSAAAAGNGRRFLYIAAPGIRNYVQYGGVGVLVYDIDNNYKFVRRIPTWTVAAGQQPENVKGGCASAATGRLYVTTIRRLLCLDLATDKILWDTAPEGGCDRPSISP